MCTIGCKTIPATDLLQLDRLTIKILAALGNAGFVQDTIIQIVKDGAVTKDEEPQFETILEALEKISKAAIATKLWVEKNMR